MRLWTVLAWLGLVVAFAGCEKGPPVPAHEHDEHGHADHAEHDHAEHEQHEGEKHDHAEHAMEHGSANETEEPAGPKIETGSFSLAVAPTQPKYVVGKTGEVEIALESRGEWHVNEDYPIRVDLKAADDVALPKAELVKDDAKEFGSRKVRFLAAVEPASAGNHEVTCDVSFAMCTEENCILERRTVAMVLEVQ